MKVGLGVVVGLVFTVIVMTQMMRLGHKLVPIEGLNPPIDMSTTEGVEEFTARLAAMTPEEQQAFINAQPLEAKLWTSLSLLVGALLGGLFGAKIAGSMKAATMIGVGLLVMTVIIVVTISHPLWLAALNLVIPLPSAWIGGRAAGVAKSS